MYRLAKFEFYYIRNKLFIYGNLRIVSVGCRKSFPDSSPVYLTKTTFISLDFNQKSYNLAVKLVMKVYFKYSEFVVIVTPSEMGGGRITY